MNSIDKLARDLKQGNFRSLIVKKDERTISHAVAIGYKWQNPAGRRQPGKYIILFEDGFIAQVNSRRLKAWLKGVGIEKVSIRKFLKMKEL